MYSLIAPPARNITLPPTAGPGEARIVIGPDLPPPLDTYTLAGGDVFAGGIVWYSQDPILPPDTTYTWECVVANLAGIITDVRRGWVVNGAVVESAPGVPLGQIWSASAGGAELSGQADNISWQAVAQTTVSGGTAAVLNGAGQTVTLISGGVAINAGGSGTEQVIITADDDITLATVIGNVELNAAADVVIDATNTVVSGPLKWRTGTGGADAISARNFSSGTLATTGTGYALQGNVTAGSIVGMSFVAPPSGRVMVTWRSTIDNNTAARGHCSPEIRTGSVVGSGTVHTGWAAQDDRAVSVNNIDDAEFGSSDLAEGLTPGTTYNVSLWQRSSAGANTATFARRGVAVFPAL